MANTLKNIMGAGVPPLTAQAVNGFAADGLTATGTNQATALQLSSDVSVVTTTASGTGVLLPSNPAPGDEIVVANLGANAVAVYPNTGGAIQGGAANAAFSLAAGKTAKFVGRTGSLNWVVVLSA